jgi:hypothetical protein
MDGLTLAPEQKKDIKERARRAAGLSAVHAQLRRQVVPYELSWCLGTERMTRVPHAHGGNIWVRDNYVPHVNMFAQLEERSAPLQARRRLLPSDKVAKAKRRAREVIVALLLVVRRKLEAQTPREVWRRILGHVNEEECNL